MSEATYVLTRNGEPIRKALKPRDAWRDDRVIGHPRDCAGICVFDDGTRMEVFALVLGADVWRVTRGGTVSYFYGARRELWREYGQLDTADRLEWDGWARVYGD